MPARAPAAAPSRVCAPRAVWTPTPRPRRSSTPRRTAATLDAWLARREDGEPVAWILGTTTFCGAPLRVDPGVYVPRRQTEDLAIRAAALPAGARPCPGPVHRHRCDRGAPPTRRARGPDRGRRPRCATRSGAHGATEWRPWWATSRRPSPVTARGISSPRSRRTSRPSALRLLPADVQRHEPRTALDGGADGLDARAPGGRRGGAAAATRGLDAHRDRRRAGPGARPRARRARVRHGGAVARRGR